MRLLNNETPGIEQKQWNVYTAAANPIVGVWARYPEYAMRLAVKHAVLSGWETPTTHVSCQDVTGDDWSHLSVAPDPRPAFVLESLLELPVPASLYARVSKALRTPCPVCNGTGKVVESDDLERMIVTDCPNCR